ncbi:MAG TPA: hypothetical protein VFT79_00690 [Solirubrobacterales bacterium]|nr:hypothetical protein [Solirubrobacterales bacterium]
MKEANALCSKYNEQMTKAFVEFSKENPSPSPAEAAEGIRAVTVPATKQEIEDLRQLTPPSGEEEKVEALIERREEALEKIEEEPNFKTSGDPFEEFNQPLTDYGLTECAF